MFKQISKCLREENKGIIDNKSGIQDTQTIRERIKQGYIGKTFKISEYVRKYNKGEKTEKKTDQRQKVNKGMTKANVKELSESGNTQFFYWLQHTAKTSAFRKERVFQLKNKKGKLSSLYIFVFSIQTLTKWRTMIHKIPSKLICFLPSSLDQSLSCCSGTEFNYLTVFLMVYQIMRDW